MKTYLVATHSFLLAVRLNEEYQVHGWQVIAPGHHYGLALFDEGRTFLAKRPGSGGKEVAIFEAQRPFKQVGVKSISGVGTAHQISIANGGLYIANTTYNSVVYERFHDGQRHEHFFFDVQEDRNHVNSVYPCGDQVFVLLHNGLRLTTSKVAVLRHDVGRGFDLEALFSLWHTGCHNVYVDSGRLLYNSSQTGELVVTDLNEQCIVKAIRFGGHVKGLSVTDDRIIVGVSDFAHRKRRRFTKGFLSVIDRRSLAKLSQVDLNFSELPHPVGNVNEVRCLDKAERAQAGKESLSSIDWQSLQMAKRNPLRYAQVRSKIWMWGVRKLKARLLQRVMEEN